MYFYTFWEDKMIDLLIDYIASCYCLVSVSYHSLKQINLRPCLKKYEEGFFHMSNPQKKPIHGILPITEFFVQLILLKKKTEND